MLYSSTLRCSSVMDRYFSGYGMNDREATLKPLYSLSPVRALFLPWLPSGEISAILSPLLVYASSVFPDFSSARASAENFGNSSESEGAAKTEARTISIADNVRIFFMPLILTAPELFSKTVDFHN